MNDCSILSIRIWENWIV